VLSNKLVDYIVSLGSHPEIINESHNILGFLIVTKTYTSQLTDLIWQTVMTSQDPRVVEAILRMIRQCMNLYEYTHILHMCQKICDLPIEAFTPPMREFCEMLLNNFVSKGRQDGMQYIDAPPYDLCVRLIRQASIATAESPIGYPDIQNFAVARLRDLLPHGPSLDIRSTIYQNCIEDVSSRTPTAPGSICVICTILRQNRATDLHALTTQHGLTQLVVEELERAITGDRHPSVTNGAASLARRELLLMIMVYEPSTISPDLGRRLWDHLVGVKSGSVNDRNISWNILNNAMKKDTDNPFIKTCFREYLPTLPPHCFTTGALDFARTDVYLWLDQIREGPPENQKFESPALQQIWRMILNAPLNSIDAAAIAVIVEVYVESVLISSMSRIRARDIHLALVDRCLKQLAAAASKLKQFTDGTSSGDEDGMVIVPSDGQFQEQERIFARSLAVLREFLKAYSMKPQFSFPRARHPPPVTSDAAEGEPMVVKYQCFDGNDHTEVKNLTLGKQNTAAYLFATLQKATGFQKYKVYCGGREITSAETDVLKSLEELNVNGLVLVQRREDAEAPAPPTTTSNPDGNRVTIEAEIVKHSDDLWGYLSMHETVATEVFCLPKLLHLSLTRNCRSITF
jgi:ubiquitin carboxyl-terminal hydrolase 34